MKTNFNCLFIFHFQHNPHKLHPAIAWFGALLFLNSIGLFYGFFVVTLTLIVVESYIFIALYSLMIKFNDEWDEMKEHFGDVWNWVNYAMKLKKNNMRKLEKKIWGEYKRNNWQKIEKNWMEIQKITKTIQLHIFL